MPTPPPAAATHPQPANSRLAEPVHFSSRCFVADCAVGSLVTDALCSWSESATSREHPYSDQAGAAGFEVCLLPTRFLGGGFVAGAVHAEAIAETVPSDNLVTLILSAAQLEHALGAAQLAAWDRCSIYDESVSWQVSGLQLSRRCDAASTQLQLHSHSANELVPAGGEARVPVVTLHSALPLLPTPAEPPIERHISAQQVVADYLQAHSPLNFSSATRHSYARIQHDASCGRSACGPADVLDRPILPASEGASALATTLWTLATLVLCAVAAMALVIWRRRRARQGLTSPSRGGADDAPAVPELAAQPRAVDERVPLKTGSTRLTSSSQLGK